MADPEKLKGWIVVRGAAAAGAVLVASAALHRLELGAPGYAGSPLVIVEIGLLMVLGLVLLAQPVLTIFYLVTKRWRGLLVVAVASAITLIAWIAAMILDSATLLYAT